jgi:excisionase family DNA binding protein
MAIELPTREDFERLENEVRQLREAVKGATITPAPEWVSIREAAERKGCHPDTIRRRIDAGELKARGSGRLREVYLP